MFLAETLLVSAVLLASPAVDTASRTFDVTAPGEALVTIRAGCGDCAWGVEGREAAALRLTLDGKYSQHLLVARGEALSDYRVTLGRVSAGQHRLTIERDAALSAKNAGPATIEIDAIDVLTSGDDVRAQSRAPILYARANTVGRFTDLPILMWYETVPTSRGRQFRYSVIFTNEDGGTPTDRLMATWGRTTDIEFVYGVEVDDRGSVIAEEFQGPGHEVPPFRGRHEGSHPLLWVSTDNNMVSESGSTAVRYAPAPERFDLTNVSREVVMDRHPWSYRLTAEEMTREGKISNDAPPKSGKIPDLQRFVLIEACAEVGDAALAFAVGVRDRHDAAARGDITWFASDRGVAEFRIVRDGCVRVAIPVTGTADQIEVRGLRAMAFTRPSKTGEPGRTSNVRLTRVNTAFMLDDHYLPRTPLLRPWTGDESVRVDGPPFEIAIK